MFWELLFSPHTTSALCSLPGLFHEYGFFLRLERLGLNSETEDTRAVSFWTQGGEVVIAMSRSFLSENGSAGVPSLSSSDIPKSFTVTHSKFWSQARFPPSHSHTPSSLCALSIQMTSYLDILFHHRGALNLKYVPAVMLCDSKWAFVHLYLIGYKLYMQPKYGLHEDNIFFMEESNKFDKDVTEGINEIPTSVTYFLQRPQFLMSPQSRKRVPPSGNQASKHMRHWVTVWSHLMGTIWKEELYECANYASDVFKKCHFKAFPAKACCSGRKIGSTAKPEEESAHLQSPSLCKRMRHMKDLVVQISADIV